MEVDNIEIGLFGGVGMIVGIGVVVVVIEDGCLFVVGYVVNCWLVEGIV